MYEVYSAQRPGRPRRSLVAAIAVLLLTVAAAQTLIFYRERATLVQLGPRNQYPDGQISVCLPIGWQPVDKNLWPTGAVIGIEAPGTDDRQARLFVFRGPPTTNGVASSAGLRALVAVSKALGADVLFDRGLEPIGAFPGVTVTMAKGRGPRAIQSPFCLGRVAIGPSGEVVGLVLQVDSAPRRADETLVDQVAKSIELTGISLDADPPTSMTAAGISFDLPRGARLIGPVNPSVPRLRLMGGDTEAGWYLDLFRVPLIGERKVADLVEDRAMSILQEVRLRDLVETFDATGREAARATLALVPGQEPTVHLLAVETDEHTALLMAGRHEPKAGGSVRELCESIAATARVDSYNELVDPESAMDAARRMIQDCRKEGVSSLLGPRSGKTQRFDVAAPAIGLGICTETCRRSTEDGGRPWLVTRKWIYEPEWPGHDRLAATEVWHLGEGGVEYSYQFERTEAGQTTIEQTERCGVEGGQVLRKVMAFRGSRSENIKVDGTFASSPLLMKVYARIAQDANPRPLVVSIIETFTAGAAYCVVQPAGRTPLPGSSLREPAWTVRLMVDYDPAPVSVHFDDEGELLAVSSDGHHWRERVDLPVEEDESPASQRRPRR